MESESTRRVGSDVNPYRLKTEPRDDSVVVIKKTIMALEMGLGVGLVAVIDFGCEFFGFWLWWWCGVSVSS